MLASEPRSGGDRRASLLLRGKRTGLPLAEIAAALQYAGPNAYSRAFPNWGKLSPTQWCARRDPGTSPSSKGRLEAVPMTALWPASQCRVSSARSRLASEAAESGRSARSDTNALNVAGRATVMPLRRRPPHVRLQKENARVSPGFITIACIPGAICARARRNSSPASTPRTSGLCA